MYRVVGAGEERVVRVAFVLGTTSGGTGRHVLMLVEGLVRRGHQVLVVGPRSVEEQFGFAAAGARFAEVAVSDRPRPAGDLRAVLAVRRLTRGADVVHAHGLRAGALAALALRPSAPARLLLGASRTHGPVSPGTDRPVSPGTAPGGDSVSAGAAGVGGVAAEGAGPGGFEGERGRSYGAGRSGWGRGRLVVTLHNALTAGGFVGFVYGVLERVVAGAADHVLVVSPDLGERMAALGARDVRAAVVPAPPLRPARRTPAEVRAELGAGERPVLLTLARLAQQKGLETLLDAAAGPWPTAEGGPEAPPLFVVAGEGPLRGALEARIAAERLPVVLLGSRDDVPDLLAAATAVVMPSRWEGQPLSLSETLMAGRPVIASAVGGIPDMVGDGGILVPYGDVEGLRRAVRDVVGDPATAARLAGAAARRGRELPDGDQAVGSVLDVYARPVPTDD
ncbi:Glycosyl transferase 4-like domain-containing protein [Nonomuraea pusilla]|uniref:Glycosyl transferase 4-like domain-containing protein n=1 Tax=Nonomuraea pusilla TaxID=46177 RepID=A0A1H7UUB2_9ACTN|nr:Glycosyl transferase 4-like domain-containing protein [Nonomuraea pusilla]